MEIVKNGIIVERKCVRFEWWVLDTNEKAIHFYESLGAQAGKGRGLSAWRPQHQSRPAEEGKWA